MPFLLAFCDESSRCFPSSIQLLIISFHYLHLSPEHVDCLRLLTHQHIHRVNLSQELYFKHNISKLFYNVGLSIHPMGTPTICSGFDASNKYLKTSLVQYFFVFFVHDFSLILASSKKK